MKKHASTYQYFLPVVFLALLIFPVINSQFQFVEFERKDENRRFKDSLKIDIGRLDYFPAEAEAYYNDNFSFRTPLLDLYHQIKFSYFKISPHPNKTIVGKDNWFFLAYAEKEIYEGNKDFSDEMLDALLEEWRYRTNYLDSMNIKTYWMIVPFKHYVYDDKLPFHIYAAEKRRVEQLKEHFADEFPDLIFDPLAMLKEEKADHKLYYQLDNHWNYRAAHLVSKEILRRIKKDFPTANIKDIPAHTWEEERLQTGIHYNVIGIDSLSENTENPVFVNPQLSEATEYGFTPIEDFPYHDEYEIRFVNDSLENSLKVLYIRDSFARHMLPFISESFQESVFIFDAWRYQLNKPIIEKVQPDVVVFIGGETQIETMTKRF